MLPNRPANALLTLNRNVESELSGTVLVALQHLLPSVEGLFRRFVSAGFRPEHVFVLGKPYSTVPVTADALLQQGLNVFAERGNAFQVGHYTAHFRALVHRFWHWVDAQLPTEVSKIIILDEGGWLCNDVPDSLQGRASVVAIEHTMYGLFSRPAGSPEFPVILMAASAAKTRFENQVIADAIIERLHESVPDMTSRAAGIIGLGNLGQAVAKRLHMMGVPKILGFDLDSDKARDPGLAFITRSKAATTLLAGSEVIIGCSGRDGLDPRRFLQRLSGSRWLASASSGDVEFQRLAKLLTRRSTLRYDPFADARGDVFDTDVTLLNGGFPLNFDRQRELEDPIRIQLTRELTFASVMQAALCVDDDVDASGLMLDPMIQRQLVQRWLAHPNAALLFPNWRDHDLDWWTKHSKGKPVDRALGEYLSSSN